MGGLTVWWRARLLLAVVMSAGLALVLVGAAKADTLGTPAPAQGEFSPGYCPTNDTVSTWPRPFNNPQYVVPPGGGRITLWSTDTSKDTPGAHLTFVVLTQQAVSRLGAVGHVIVTDPETLPSPLPASGVVSYQLSPPITVAGGEWFALYSSDAGGSSAPVCFWRGAPDNEEVAAWAGATPPEPGDDLGISAPFGGPIEENSELDLAATVAVTEDATVQSTATDSATTMGNVVLLSSTVTDDGPGSDTITFTDAVPKGFAVELVDPGSGTCSTVGQRVTCTISGLVAGQSAPIEIVAKATAPGVFKNMVSVSLPPEDTDPNHGNDSASTTLTVRPPGKCLVPRLAGMTQSFAVTVLDRLGCRPEVQHADRRAVKRGEVIRTGPRAGTYAAGRRVVVTISTGW